MGKKSMRDAIAEQKELIAILTDYVRILRKKYSLVAFDRNFPNGCQKQQKYCNQELDKNELQKSGKKAYRI